MKTGVLFFSFSFPEMVGALSLSFAATSCCVVFGLFCHLMVLKHGKDIFCVLPVTAVSQLQTGGTL